MYKSRVRCEEKGKEIIPGGTKSNPPTGTGDTGFTFNNEFNALSSASVLCGTAAVENMAANDYKRGEVSSFDAYVWIGGSKALEGALARAAFCMVPYAAEVVAGTVAPYGMAGFCLPAGTFISGETIATAAMSVGYTVTCSNMLVKVNDSIATVSGNNIMANMMGQENYQAVKDVSEAASNTVFMLGLSNPRLYGTDNNVGNVKENALYQNGKTNFENEVWESKGGSATANPYDL